MCMCARTPLVEGRWYNFLGSNLISTTTISNIALLVFRIRLLPHCRETGLSLSSQTLWTLDIQWCESDEQTHTHTYIHKYIPTYIYTQRYIRINSTYNTDKHIHTYNTYIHTILTVHTYVYTYSTYILYINIYIHIYCTHIEYIHTYIATAVIWLYTGKAYFIISLCIRLRDTKFNLLKQLFQYFVLNIPYVCMYVCLIC